MLGGLVNRPPAQGLLYRACRSYVNRCTGENNTDLYSNGEFFLLKKLLPTSSVIFDVGANIGDWAELALSINPGLNIHCFEPSKATYEILKIRKIIGSISLNNVGLGASPEERTLHIFSEGAGANSLYKRKGLQDIQMLSEQIKIETLDSYCDRMKIDSIDFLKLDVEGHELDVLFGATKMLKLGCIHYIQFEYGGTYIDARRLLKDMFEQLQPLGYSMYKIYPRSLQLYEKYDQVLENFQYQNWLAIKH